MDLLTQKRVLISSAGEDIYLFTLCNANGTEVCITNYGAIITAFRIRMRNGSVNDIVLGFDDVESYFSPAYLAAYPYLGAVIGRYGNRIGHGIFTLDGKTYELARNNANDHLHGGLEGFDKKIWRLTGSGSTPHAWVELSYSSPDGEEGYPGTLHTTIRFELNAANELSYAFTSTCDAPTIVNLTHHSYFNLNGGRGTVADYKLQIGASHWLQQNDNFVTTGRLLPVADTPLDFRTPHRVGEHWDPEHGYDQSFVLDEAVAVPAAVESEESGIRLEVYTTEPVVHLYTARWLGPLTGKGGQVYGSSSALCLETQKHPNAINVPHFPHTILRPGETYHTRTTYRVLEMPEK